MRHRRTGRPGQSVSPDPDEFEAFVGQSLRPLTRTAVLITWNLADAEDVVQEALYRTARHWGRVRAMTNPYAYVRQAVVHQALRGVEKRATQQRELYGWPEGLAAKEPATDDSFGAIELRLDLAQMLGELSARQRAVVVLRFAEQLTEMEVAELLGWPLGTVKSTTARALERLRSTRSTVMDSPAERVDKGHLRPAVPNPTCSSHDTRRSHREHPL